MDGADFSVLPTEATFSFELGGLPSSALLSTWSKAVSTYPVRTGNHTRTRTIYFQPLSDKSVNASNCIPRSTAAVCISFELRLIAERTTYFPGDGNIGNEHTGEFRNTGRNASLPLCAVRSLDAVLALDMAANLTVTGYTGHGAYGQPPLNPSVASAVPI